MTLPASRQLYVFGAGPAGGRKGGSCLVILAEADIAGSEPSLKWGKFGRFRDPALGMLDCLRIAPRCEAGHRQVVAQIGPQRIAWANPQGLLREFYGAFRVSCHVLDIGEADERYHIVRIEVMTLPRARQSVLEAILGWSIGKQ